MRSAGAGGVHAVRHISTCLRYFRFRILFLNQTLQSEREMCFPKRCRAQACFQEALSEVVLSLVARGAHGSAIAQWRAAASPRFHLRAIKFVVKKSSESAKSRPRFCIARFFFSVSKIGVPRNALRVFLFRCFFWLGF